MDGWTAPIVASYLGVVIIWCDEGTVHRAILDFIRYVISFQVYNIACHLLSFICRLTESHTGIYLAEKVAELLRQYGLQDLVRYIIPIVNL